MEFGSSIDQNSPQVEIDNALTVNLGNLLVSTPKDEPIDITNDIVTPDNNANVATGNDR